MKAELASLLSTHKPYQFKKIDEFVSVLPGGEVHKVLGQPAAQVGTRLNCDLTVGTTEGRSILYKGKEKGKSLRKSFFKSTLQTEKDTGVAIPTTCPLLYYVGKKIRY